MSDWTGGYVSDIEYVPGFYREQSPGHLDLACLMCGVEAPRRVGAGEPFTYCEIGCGQGTTVMALAAANPEGRFYAIDFMPAHIARAEDVRRQSRIDNIEFLEADVCELADGAGSSLPRFDYITLHGVYSWVSPGVRAGVVRFLNRFLKPGGVVYVSYNAQPVWSSVEPTQRMLYEFAASVQGPSDHRAKSGIDFIKKMVAAQSPSIDANAVKHLLDLDHLTRSAPDRAIYLAHEFLNACWEPLYHMDVARDFAEAKLSFVASASLPENFGSLGLSDEAREVVDSLPDGPLRETAKDYFNRRGFRRDVFVRGKRVITAREREDRLSEIMLAPAVSPFDFRYEEEVLSSKVNLNPETYKPIFEALAKGPKPVSDLLELGRAGGSDLSATELVGMMVGFRKAFAILCDVTTDGVEACARLNSQIVADAFRGNRRVVYSVATPVGHSGLNLASLEALVLDGLFQGVPETVEALTDHVCTRSEADPAAVKTTVTDDDAGLRTDDDPADETVPLGERVARGVTWCLEEALPLWRTIGVAPPPRH